MYLLISDTVRFEIVFLFSLSLPSVREAGLIWFFKVFDLGQMIKRLDVFCLLKETKQGF